MSGFYNPLDPHQQQTYPHILQELEDIPEDPNQLPAQFYDPGATPDDPQQLSSPILSRFFDAPAGEAGSSEPKPIPKSRRRHPPGSDHVKHRRTRSGCYTCRQRRVKCDETRPICERCKKGNRDCTWPDPSSSTKSGSASKSVQQKKAEAESDSSTGESEDEHADPSVELDAEGETSKASKDVQSPTAPTIVAGKQGKQPLSRKHAGEPLGARAKEKSLSPSTDESKSQSEASVFSGKFSTASISTVQDDPLYARLKPDQIFYVDYHTKSIDYYHYFFKHDPSNFVHSDLVKAALSYDPLLYALIGFSAFHFALAQPDGKLSKFLGYYNKSVSLLRKDIASGRPHTDSTILTILQLATFEEYLGDWVNLMGHQKAAFEMIKELHTPDSMVQTDFHRKMLTWYARFDIYAGLMAGNETILGKEWFYSHEQYTKVLAMNSPDDIGLRVEHLYAQNRVLGYEMAQLLAKVPKGELSIPDFMRENQLFLEKIADWKVQLESFCPSSEYLITDFSASPPLDAEDIVNPYIPGRIYKEPYFAVNYMMIDCLAIESSYKYQCSLMLQQPLPPELFNLSLEQCQIIEAIELWAESPPGTILPAQASLGLLCLIFPREDKYINWCRKKLVKIEKLGYIYPPSLRSKLAELWATPSINEWWLPNGEGQPPLIRSIRSFIEERTVKPRNQANEDIRTMKAMLSKMDLNESPKDSPESSGSVPESSVASAAGAGSMPRDYEGGQSLSMAQISSSDQRDFSPGQAEQRMEDWMTHWNSPDNQQGSSEY